uniref:NADH-ubiquinone oxidoreductase chain 5 n=1 Tax=Tettigarcta crinita TaxID=295286 RepID=A0A3S7MEM6_9HEMI|nr:NADH dehydrogenase subunit 5 [Tettigarcta crinita]
MIRMYLNLYLSLLFLIISFIMLFFSIFMIINDYYFMMEWYIMSINSCNMYMTILFDFMSTLFMSIVMFISSMVIMYSGMYMMSDKFINRFILIVMMFVLSMMMMIISPNLISILIGWDGLGLVSYCLVIFYQNLFSNNAGMLTALMNRVGDVAILLTIAWMMNFGSWNFFLFLNKFCADFMLIMVIIASFTKSAQIPFSSWLPAAMAAPTPVSALVHSSTLVTAGVYLMIRFSSLIYKLNLNNFIMFLSICTMLMSGMGANYEFDLKKIIALSTLSQLGMMMSIMMFGFPMLAFFHLITHALFKALLFLCAGVVIHNMINNQDIRYMGSLSYQMPMTMTSMNISNISLCGIPFMSGFYSKDLIMEYMSYSNVNFFFLLMMYFGIGLTASYSARMTFYTMTFNFNSLSFISIVENMNYMSISILILTIYSIMSGTIFNWLMFNQLMITILPIDLKLLTMMFSLFGLWLGYEISIFSTKMSYLIENFLGSMWFLSQISTFHNQLLLMNLSVSFQKSVDQGWGEFWGSMGLINLLNFTFNFNVKMMNNNFKVQLISFMLWIMLMTII